MKPIAAGLARHRHRQARVHELACLRAPAGTGRRSRSRAPRGRSAARRSPAAAPPRPRARASRRSACRRRRGSRRSPRRRPGIAPPASSVRESTSSRSIDAPSSPRKRLRRPSSCARSSASESSRTMPSMRVFISETSASTCCCPPLPRLRERTSTTSSTSASTAAAAPTATSAVVAVTASTIISLVETSALPGQPQLSPSRLTVIAFRAAGYGFKTIKPLVRIRTNGRASAAESSQPSAFCRLTLEGELRYHAHPVGRGLTPASLCCVRPHLARSTCRPSISWSERAGSRRRRR